MSTSLSAAVRINVALNAQGAASLQGLSRDLEALIPSIQSLNTAGGTFRNVGDAISVMSEVSRDAANVTLVLASQSAPTAAGFRDIASALERTFPAAENVAVEFKQLSEGADQVTIKTSGIADVFAELTKSFSYLHSLPDAKNLIPDIPTINLSGATADVSAVREQVDSLNMAYQQVAPSVAGSTEAIREQTDALQASSQAISSIRTQISTLSVEYRELAESPRFNLQMTSDTGGNMSQAFQAVGESADAAFESMASLSAEANNVSVVLATNAPVTAERIEEIRAAAEEAFPALEQLKISIRGLSAAEAEASSGQDMLKVSLSNVTQGLNGTSVSARAILLDFRMIAFGLRTLRTELGSTDPMIQGFSDAMIVATSAATMFVSAGDILLKMKPALDSLAAGELTLTAATSGLTAALGSLLTVIWPLLAVIAALAIALAAIDWMSGQRGANAAAEAAKEYADEAKSLTEQIEELKDQQKELNLETSRYSILQSQLEYAIQMQGFATPQQEAALAALESQNAYAQILSRINQYQTDTSQVQLDKTTKAQEAAQEDHDRMIAEGRMAWFTQAMSGTAIGQLSLDLASMFSPEVKSWLESGKSEQIVSEDLNNIFGGENASIWDMLVQALQDNTAALRSGGGIPSEAVTIPGNQYGGTAEVNAPTLFLAGEAGRETVSIAPYAQAGDLRRNGGGSIGPVAVSVAFNGANFSTPESARREAEKAGRVAGEEALEAMRWGLNRP